MSNQGKKQSPFATIVTSMGMILIIIVLAICAINAKIQTNAKYEKQQQEYKLTNSH